ncbi:two-component system response regulator [Vulgatibacter sp.]|uniref:response regulator n=1 Tax=Vulgatibacter sp. TaxID=1971226 RepID=UPI0035686697
MTERPIILVVDDDPDLRAVLCEALGADGYDVIPAADGAEALTWLRLGFRPRLILLDLLMPVMDGWRFRESLGADPALAAIPVILISTEDNARREPIDVAMLLRKPLALGELRAMVARFCELAPQQNVAPDANPG